MHLRSLTGLALVSLCAWGAGVVRSDTPTEKTPQEARKAVERGLAFLEKDAVEWKKERQCATCHHGVMSVWALGEARNQSYAVNAETLADLVRWTRERFLPGLEKPRDTRPGYSLVSTPALDLALMSQASPRLDLLSRDELGRVADHVARHQEADGAWLLPPPQNGPPPVFESREVLTLLAVLALEPATPGDPAAVRASRDKAAAWLSKAEPTESTQVAALRLFLDLRAGKTAEQLQPGIDRLLKRQGADGGWPQDKGLASDAYATGQALYFLHLAGVKNDRPEVRRGVAFLAARQREDGSWPMTSRAHPGAKPFTNPAPITHIGSAWATLGLLQSVPK
jgi:hypothetical protein